MPQRIWWRTKLQKPYRISSWGEETIWIWHLWQSISDKCLQWSNLSMITNIIRKSIAAHEPIEYISSTAVLEQNYYHISILYLKGFSPSWTNLVWVFIHVCLLGFFDRARFFLHSFLFVSIITETILHGLGWSTLTFFWTEDYSTDIYLWYLAWKFFAHKLSSHSSMVFKSMNFKHILFLGIKLTVWAI